MAQVPAVVIVRDDRHQKDFSRLITFDGAQRSDTALDITQVTVTLRTFSCPRAQLSLQRTLARRSQCYCA